jgi:hypothetical protein
MKDSILAGNSTPSMGGPDLRPRSDAGKERSPMTIRQWVLYCLCRYRGHVANDSQDSCICCGKQLPDLECWE